LTCGKHREIAKRFISPTSILTEGNAPIPGPTSEVSSQKARELKIVVILNLLEREGGGTYDSSPVIDADGKAIGKTRMVHILEERSL
jgi:predicted amidohydrolase